MARTEASRKMEKGGGVDPTTLSVVWNKFESLLDESGEKVLHGTQSFILALVRDFGLALLNPKGEIAAAAAYVARHIFTASESARNIIKRYKNDFKPGDLVIGNDPYTVRSGHLPDWTFVRPIFFGDALVGFFQFRGHMADTGGFLPGGYGPGAYDIIAEGLNIPPLKILKNGVLDKDLWELVCRNVRNPTQVDMDTMLINGAMTQAEEQMAKVFDKYGPEVVSACMEEIIDAGESAARAEIAKMPDGVYHGESATDWDGTTDKPVWVRVEMAVQGEELTFDFSQSDPQVTFVNSPMGNTVSIVMESFYAMIDPSAPKNQGSFKPVRVIAPEGTVVNPKYPATVGACGISVGEIIMEACKIALAKAIPEKAMGAFARHCCPINIGMDPDEIDPRTGTIKQYMSETFASDGSGGAMKGYDGWQGVGPSSFLASFVRPDIEFYESEVPFRIMRYELMQDREGAGEFRGGPGVFVEMVSDTKPGAPSFLMTGNSDGMVIAARGAAGEELPKLEMWIESPNGEKRVLRTMANEPIQSGEKCYTRAPGGGGWGNPLDRNVRKVQDDVIDGLVSIQRARDVYGVVIDPKTLEVQDEATETLRKEMRGKQER